MATQKRLGRGLDALLGNRHRASTDIPAAGDTLVDIAIDALTPGQYQPRQSINDDALAELVQSVQQQGVLQALLIRPLPESTSKAGAITHEIVAGERRWRAAKLAGLNSVPAVIRDFDDKSAIAVALIENLQREDLSAIDIAESLKKLTDEFNLTHQQVADTVGRSRSSVSNYLRLLELNSVARECLSEGSIEMGHARAILSLDQHQQGILAKKASKQNLSVRQVEDLVTKLQATPETTQKTRLTNTQTRWLQKQFADELGVSVHIHTRDNGQNTLKIDFEDLGQLQVSLGRLEKLVEQVVDTAGPHAILIKTGDAS